jgi:hypothetical protein
MHQNHTPWNRILSAVLCLMAVSLSAAAGDAAVRAIQVNYDKTPLKAALTDVQEKSGFKISFADKLIAGAEPVTLRREASSADDILRELLRPEGLEAIQTDEKLIAVIPAYSDWGMTKAFGRALATAIRLGNKLDGAVLEGNEIRVPGWTDSDDRDLELGLTDFISAIAYFEATGNRNDIERAEELLAKLYESKDPLVRAGALLPALTHGNRKINRSLDNNITKALASSNVAERTAGALFLAARLERHSSENPLENAGEKLKKAAQDPEAAVRAMATIGWILALSKGLSLDPTGELLDGFKKDRSCFVRQTLRFMVLTNPREMTRLPKNEAAEKLRALQSDDEVRAMISDPNPIARAAALGCVLVVGEKNDRRKLLLDHFASAEVSRDPWMTWLRPLVSPMLENEPRANFEGAVQALVSKKPSHQIAAGLIGFGNTVVTLSARRSAAGKKKDEKLPDLSALQTLSQSQWRWARLAGVFVDALAGVAPAVSNTTLSAEQLDAAEKRFHAALQSPSESVRPIALVALALRKSMRLPEVAQLKSEDLFKRAACSRRVSEMLLGTALAAQHLSADELLAFLEPLVLDDEHRDTAALLLFNIKWGTRSINSLKPADAERFWDRLAEAVTARPSPSLEAALSSLIHYGGSERQKTVLSALAKKGGIEALAAACRANRYLFSDEELALLAAERLQEAADGGEHTVLVLDALAAISENDALPINAKLRVLKVYSSALRNVPGTPREEQARIAALNGYWKLADHQGQGDPRIEGALRNPPAEIMAAMKRALALAGDAQYSPQLPLLAAKSVALARRVEISQQWAVSHPGFASVVEAAVQKIAESSHVSDKLEVWTALAQSGDQPAIEALIRLFDDPSLSDNDSSKAISALTRRAQQVPATFGVTLLRIAKDEKQSRGLRRNAFFGLGYFGKAHQEEIETLVFKAPPDEALLEQMARTAAMNTKDTRLYQKALASYDTLPSGLLLALLSTGCSMPQAKDAPEFILKALVDERLLKRESAGSDYNILLFYLNQEHSLRAFLKDSQKLKDALATIEKKWPEVQRPGYTPRIAPEIQAIYKKLDGLAAKPKAENKAPTPAVRPPPPPSDDF